MSERGIIMSGDNPRLILEGRKTQTRRLVRLPTSKALEFRWRGAWKDGGPSSLFKASEYLHVPFRCLADGRKGWSHGTTERVFCPYGAPGDRLWVRETWRYRETKSEDLIQYRSDNGLSDFNPPDDLGEKYWDRFFSHGDDWRPSIFMSRWASRITLKIIKVRVERLQDISEQDAVAEGMPSDDPTCTASQYYMILWDALHGKGAWKKNPWVWVLEFKKVESPHPSNP